MTKFIMRVDDVGQAPEQHKPDTDLEFFKSWWNAGGWGKEPIYLGVVPNKLSQKDIDYLLELERTTSAVISLHGWDHADQELTYDHIRKAAEVFPNARTVIPPYNKYNYETINGVKSLGERSVLFGGFHEKNERGREEDHKYGPAPNVIDGVLHLSTEWSLYEHCYRMVPNVQQFQDPGYPVVVTAHLRWDIDFFGGVKQLREALEGKLVTVEEAWPT